MNNEKPQKRKSDTCRDDIRDGRRCIVCSTFSASFFLSVDGDRYERCGTCHATFLDPGQRLSIDDEHARYRQHRNDPWDQEYRRFLSRLADPLLKRLPPRAKGLDYGCGPGPALACMLHEAGHRMRLFDPLFFPDPEPLEGTYDFIVCTEVIEHFHRPFEEFARFNRMLRPGGWLALMTCFLTDDDRFATWHYRRDPTHVVFFRAATLRHIARRFQWRCEIPAKDVALMQKPCDTKDMHRDACHGIRTALNRMAAGEYGDCMNCDEEIAEGRLRADPSVLTRIACARASDGG